MKQSDDIFRLSDLFGVFVFLIIISIIAITDAISDRKKENRK